MHSPAPAFKTTQTWTAALLFTAVSLLSSASPAAAIHDACEWSTFSGSHDVRFPTPPNVEGQDYGELWENLIGAEAPRSTIHAQMVFNCKVVNQNAGLFISYMLHALTQNELSGSEFYCPECNGLPADDARCGPLQVYEGAALKASILSQWPNGILSYSDQYGWSVECAYDPAAVINFLNGHTYRFQVFVHETYWWDVPDGAASYRDEIGFRGWINPRSSNNFYWTDSGEKVVCWRATPVSPPCLL